MPFCRSMHRVSCQWYTNRGPKIRASKDQKVNAFCSYIS